MMAPPAKKSVNLTFSEFQTNKDQSRKQNVATPLWELKILSIYSSNNAIEIFFSQASSTYEMVPTSREM